MLWFWSRRRREDIQGRDAEVLGQGYPKLVLSINKSTGRLGLSPGCKVHGISRAWTPAIARNGSGWALSFIAFEPKRRNGKRANTMDTGGVTEKGIPSLPCEEKAFFYETNN